jgi:hypothetical protein
MLYSKLSFDKKWIYCYDLYIAVSFNISVACAEDLVYLCRQ